MITDWVVKGCVGYVGGIVIERPNCRFNKLRKYVIILLIQQYDYDCSGNNTNRHPGVVEHVFSGKAQFRLRA